MSKISNFYLVSVAEEAGFLACFVGNPQDRFSRNEACILSPFQSQQVVG